MAAVRAEDVKELTAQSRRLLDQAQEMSEKAKFTQDPAAKRELEENARRLVEEAETLAGIARRFVAVSAKST